MNLILTSLQKEKQQRGQTLIETVIAIFILVSGIAAAVGLAIFAFASSQNITKHMIAVGLAREGIEAVKNMRDTNWLQGSLSNTCYNPKTAQDNDADCYPNWLNQGGGYDINPTSNPGTQNFRLHYEDDADFWDLDSENCSPTCNFGLNFDKNTSLPSFFGFYTYSGSGVSHTSATSEYARKITLTEEDGVAQYGSGANNPFNKDSDAGYRLKVVSQVWWADKKCPRSNGWPGQGKCSMELQTYLTNWKDYEIP